MGASSGSDDEGDESFILGHGEERLRGALTQAGGDPEGRRRDAKARQLQPRVNSEGGM